MLHFQQFLTICLTGIPTPRDAIASKNVYKGLSDVQKQAERPKSHERRPVVDRLDGQWD